MKLSKQLCLIVYTFLPSAEAEETETFTLMEVKEKIESGDGTGWKLFFKEGVERIEVEQIEKDLPSSTAKEDIRYDFTFYTPSCREVCVKVFSFIRSTEHQCFHPSITN